MEESKKELRIRIEAPSSEPLDIPLGEPESLPWFYRLLLLLTFVCSGGSLYLWLAK